MNKELNLCSNMLGACALTPQQVRSEGGGRVGSTSRSQRPWGWAGSQRRETREPSSAASSGLAAWEHCTRTARRCRSSGSARTLVVLDQNSRCNVRTVGRKRPAYRKQNCSNVGTTGITRTAVRTRTEGNTRTVGSTGLLVSPELLLGPELKEMPGLSAVPGCWSGQN